MLVTFDIYFLIMGQPRPGGSYWHVSFFFAAYSIIGPVSLSFLGTDHVFYYAW